MQHVIPLKETRKFHDAWAAILFAIVLGAANTVAFITLGSAQESTKDSLTPNYSLIPILAVANSVLFAAEVFVAFITLIFCPKAAIYGSLGFFAVLSLASCLLAGPLGIVMALLSILILAGVYWFLIRPHIEYIAGVVSACASILSQYIVRIMLTYLIVNVLLFAQVVVISFALSSENLHSAALVGLFVLSFYWSCAVANYFYQAFVSAIVFSHINRLQQGQSGVFRRSLAYSAYALGSICLGGLLVAIVQTLKAFVSARESRNNSRRGQGGAGLAETICLAMIRILLSFLEAIIAHINRLVFSYIALHGTGYKESVNCAFQEITARGYRGVASLMAIDYVLAIFAFISLFATILLNIAISGLSSAPNFICAIIFICIFLVLFSGVMSMLSSGVLALVYSKIEFSKAVEAYDKGLSQLIDSKNEQVVELMEEGQ